MEYPWLTYSKFEDGIYCKYCVIFANDWAGQSTSQPLGQFVNQPFRFWRKLTEKVREHQGKKYHADSMLTADSLKSIVEGRKQDIVDMLDTARVRLAKENRKKLSPIIRTVIFCGRNGLPLRGHRDHGQIDVINEEREENHHDGNFRQLLRFRVDAGDETLKNHLKSSANNATYLSPSMQNEIIQACNEIILKKLVQKVNSSKCFSIIADETTDISLMEQVSLCVRYVESKDNKFVLNENFLQFVPVTSTRGEDLARTILETLGSLGLDLSYIRGQGYDGAAAMSGAFNGCQAKIKEKCPSALYVHCASHSLNLAISDACHIKDVRNCVGILEKAYSFMNTPKRNGVLQESIVELSPTSRKESLKKLSPTRWIERHEAIMVMVELLHPLIHALESIENWQDKDSSAGACILLNSLRTSNFVITLLSMEKIFSLTLPLSRMLQAKTMDLVGALQLCDDIVEELETMRRQSEEVFHTIFQNSESTLKQIINDNYKIVLPRIVSQQKHRPNYIDKSPESYFRISIFNEFLDSTIMHLKDRFSKHKAVMSSLNILISPDNDVEEKLKKLQGTYPADISESPASLIAEYQLWRRKLITLTQQNNLTAIEALQECNEDIFPNIFKLLKILVTLPVTTCTAERSFSTLKYLKNYLRNSTSEMRLNGLCLLYIYKNVSVSEDEVFNILQKEKRRINITL